MASDHLFMRSGIYLQDSPSERKNKKPTSSNALETRGSGSGEVTIVINHMQGCITRSREVRRVVQSLL